MEQNTSTYWIAIKPAVLFGTEANWPASILTILHTFRQGGCTQIVCGECYLLHFDY